MGRGTRHEFFMSIARTIGERSTCDRAHVGCVLVRDNFMISSGYNGSLSGDSHCDDVGHHMVDGHCVKTMHAEANAISYAARVGVSTKGSVLYTTHYPCWNCFKLLASAGVVAIWFENAYRVDKLVESTSFFLGIEVIKIEMGRCGANKYYARP